MLSKLVKAVSNKAAKLTHRLVIIIIIVFGMVALYGP
jgi:hypothetical protein